MNARTIYQQTGWRGPMPVSICQDHNILATVTEYDFDLNDKAFQTYCRGRGVLQQAREGKAFAFTADHAATKEQFFKDFRKAEKHPLFPQYVFSDEEMETHWKIMLAAKGALQDCWEIFKGRR